MTDPQLAELIDHHEISKVLIRYAHALDARDWELLGSCFTADGVTDYRELGGINEGREQIVALCRGALSGLDASQHLIGSVAIEVDGEEATAVCYLQAQHVYKGAEGGENFLVGGTYRDRLVRAATEGWLIAHRTLEASWVQGNPAVFELAAARWAKAQQPQP